MGKKMPVTDDTVPNNFIIEFIAYISKKIAMFSFVLMLEKEAFALHTELFT